MKIIRQNILILLAVMLFAGAVKADATLEDLNRSSSVFSSYNASVKRAKGEDTIDSYRSVIEYGYSMLTRSGTRDFCLKDITYYFWDELQIPGMPQTKETDLLEKRIFSTSQCPQGICASDTYIFLSSYSAEANCLGEIMVFDKTSGDYLFTIGMNMDSHLGGIAFDGESLWACNSDQNSMERLSYDFVELMARENQGELVDATDLVDIYSIECSPSFITYYDNRLWIGTHSVISKSTVSGYYYDKRKDTLTRMNSYTIPSKVQGMSFSTNGRVYLSVSYGRRASSYLLVYSDISYMNAFTDEPVKRVEMPPCSEELIWDDNTLYILFESAGEKYYEGTDGNGGSLSPIDQILCIPLDDNGYIISR